MNIFERLFFAILIAFGLYTFFRYAFWWFKPEHIPSNWITQKYAFLQFIDFGLFAILSIVVFFGLILKIGTWFTTWFMKRPVHVAPLSGLKVAFVTCYVPGNEPVSMLKETLVAMREADYKHDTWVLDEGNSKEVKQLTKELGVYYFSRHEIDKYNQPHGPFRKKTKAGNLNSWRNEFESHYDIVAQVDMDHVPHKDYLTKLLGYFKDPTVGFVGIPQIYKNTDNWIAKGAAEQTHFYYGPLQQGFYGSDMPFLIGTTHVYRVKAMSEFGGYSPTIAEDYLTGMHFFSNRWKGVYVPEILAEGLGPVTWVDYFNQQMRWSYGLFEILFKHTKNHFVKMSFTQKLNLIFSQLFYFSGLISLTGLTLTFLYLIAGINSTNMHLWEWIEYSFPAYLSGLLVMLFLHKFYIDPKKEPIFGLRGVFLGQAAALIYAVSFMKFIFRQKLVYKVTSKESTTEKPSLNIFSYHIIILLYSVLALLISFILQNESPVMRFWVILNIAFMSFILISAYWRDTLRLLAIFFIKTRIILLKSKMSKHRLLLFSLLAPVTIFVVLLTFNVARQRALSFTDVNVANVNESLESPVDLEGIKSSMTVNEKFYSATAKKGNSTPILYRRILSEYLKDNNLNLTKAESEKVVNELVASNPVNLKTGDTIKITSQELALFISTQIGLR